jgi:hypothetical protein
VGVKRFSVISLFFALLFGPQMRIGMQPVKTGSPSSSTQKSAERRKDTTAPPMTASQQNGGNCGADAFALYQKRHWWLSREISPGCSLTLSPLWNQICALDDSHKAGGDPEDGPIPKYLAEEASRALNRQRKPTAEGLSGFTGLHSEAKDVSVFHERCLAKVSVRSMMASLPNPLHTPLGLMTDRAIETIQVVATEADFLPFSAYLPWPPPSAGAAGSPNPLQLSSQPDSSDPGLLIFRSASSQVFEGDIVKSKSTGRTATILRQVDDSHFEVAMGAMKMKIARDDIAEVEPKYLLIFLIPEVLTTGLDQNAFSTALRIIRVVSPRDTKPIPFAGPVFSGSVVSLKALDSGLGDACIHAVSGSITNAREYSLQKKDCNSMLTLTETPDHVAISKFVAGASALGYCREQIAILSEEGTEYGRQNDKDMNGLWFLHFPREISKLRNAYGAEAGKAVEKEKVASPPLGWSSAKPDLGMQWQDPDAARGGNLETYGGTQTPLSQETVLSTLSITLRAQGIRVLGILATDPMDEAFLIHSIKESSPDVRLFLRDPDLLFLRTPDVGSLNGTLLVSNYPLIPQNRFWSSNDLTFWSWSQPEVRRLVTFPSSFQEGEYNALLQLMEKRHLVANGKEGLEAHWPRGRYGTADPSMQPLWLATLGTAGIFPIDLYGIDERSKVSDENHLKELEAKLDLHSLELGPPQFFPILCWSLIAGLGILQVLGLGFPKNLRLDKKVPLYFKRDFDISDRTANVTLAKILCHIMAILTIALTQLILGSSYIFFRGSHWEYLLLACLVLGVTLVLLHSAGSLILMLYDAHKRRQEPAVPNDSNRIISTGRTFLSSVVGASVLVVAGISWVAMTVEGSFVNAFLHFRDLNISSGVAPVLPLVSMLMIFYFGIWAYLRRLSYWDGRYTEMCNLKLDPVNRQDFAPDVTAIDTCLLGPLENRKWLLGFGLTFLVSILALRPWITLDMIELLGVQWFALSVFGFALLTLWLNWFRFINIWVHLRNILENLEKLPLRAAFERLPREKPLPILQGSSAQALLPLLLDRLRALARADASKENIELDKQFEKRIEALMDQGVIKTEIVEEKKVVGGYARSGLRAYSTVQSELVREVREEMTHLIDSLSSRLLEQYWSRGSSSSTQDQTANPADLKFLLAEDIIALPFYAYIRNVIGELRNLLFFIGVALSLLFAAFHTYAFRADQAIDWWFFGLFAFMGFGIVLVIAQIERNPLLSRLSNTTPGELGTGFYLQLMKYGAVPILTIFGSQIPWVSNVLLKLVQPALEALH